MLEKKKKIVCTIGPATESEEMLEKLITAGCNVVRFNFSHDTHAGHKERMERVRRVAKRLNQPVALLLDTKGPEIRCGVFKNGQEEFTKGEIVKITRDDVEGTHERFHIDCPELYDDLKEGNTLLIDDGKMKLTVLSNNGKEMECRVEVSGPIKTRKGCNAPGVKLSMPFISAKDESDLRFGCKMDVDYIAASFVRRADDVLAIRDILASEGKSHIQIFAKIENEEGFENLESILKVADGIMVARGDLGVEVETQFVPIYQKRIIKVCNAMGKPVITATHMLDSMTANPRPTRAEASDVCNAVLDGSDAVMLSAESAAGEYPIEAVTTMATISQATEGIIDYSARLDSARNSFRDTYSDAIGLSAADVALKLKHIKAIVCFTQSGNSARRLSKYRPCVPIIAITFDERTQRSLAVNCGVTALLSEVRNDMVNDVELASDFARQCGLKKGDLCILVAGYPQGEGSTNMMRIVEVK